jgi:hypothetical protein
MLSMAYFLYLYSSIDFLTNTWWILFPQLFQGLGIALVMTPLITMGMNAVDRKDTGHASWMLNLCQRGGGAYSISILGTLLHRQTIIQKDILGGSAIAQSTPPAAVIRQGMSLGFSAQEAGGAAKAALGRYLGQAAASMAFKNLFFMACIFTLTALIPCMFLSGDRPKPPTAEDT